jgi:gliding motility-associated-like protein
MQKTILIVLSFVLSLLSPATASAVTVKQTSPSLRCLAVQPNGDVLLSWVLADTSQGNAPFHAYYIYSSANAAGPFTAVDSVFTYSSTSYFHVGANANMGSVYYQVRTCYLNPGFTWAPPADVLQTLYMILGNPGDGTAHLRWNALSSPLPPTTKGENHIYREYPTGTWKQIDSTTALSYIDTISICRAPLNYVIEISDSSGCTSISNRSSSVFSDIIPPSLVTLDTVSVDASGHAQISWFKDHSLDTKGYVIYKNIGGTWVAIDTVFGAGITSYTYPKSTAGTGSEQYGMAAFDSCGNISVVGSDEHSLFLSLTKNVCSADVRLNWNDFIHMPQGLGSYKIMLSVNGGPYTIAQTNTSADSSYVAANLVPGTTYCFYIVATNKPNTRTAESNKVCYTATGPKTPKFNYLRVATVASTNSVTLAAYVDISSGTSKYNFYRSLSPLGPFVLVGTVPAPCPSNIYLTDSDVNTSLATYYYKMYAVDSCGKEGFVTNMDRTILLKVVANDETTTNTLSWNEYEQWPGPVSSYSIYRAIDGVWTTSPIANIPSGGTTTTYNDNVSLYYPSGGRFDYYVQALEGNGNPYAFMDSSRSNVAEALQNAELYIPNAFTPEGKNPIFKPEGSFVNATDYHFLIFDRWGQKVFESSDKTVGWDGSLGGKIAEQGVFVYQISFKTARGEYIDKKGTVALIH